MRLVIFQLKRAQVVSHVDNISFGPWENMDRGPFKNACYSPGAVGGLVAMKGPEGFSFFFIN